MLFRMGAASFGIARSTSSLLSAVASALAITFPLTASRAVAEMLYLSPRRLKLAGDDRADALINCDQTRGLLIEFVRGVREAVGRACARRPG